MLTTHERPAAPSGDAARPGRPAPGPARDQVRDPARDDASPGGADGLLRPGRNVWRTAHAPRAAVLSDGATYFGALRAALREARHSIVILGWDIDSRTRLVGGEGPPADGLPETLGAFLSALAARRPDLSIRLLLWDYSVLYAMERELLPALALRWNTPEQVELCLDDSVPFGASHHQKVVVVDGALAFAGGLDLTIRRWDTGAHDPDDARRADPSGRPYPPFHDVQMMVDGEAARALAALAAERWRRSACEDLPDHVASPPGQAAPDLWPAAVVPDFRDARIGIARTEPAHAGREEVREVARLYEDMIGAARRTIYMENQFFTCLPLARALIRRMREEPGLEAVLVAPRTHHTWLEHRTMLAGRIRFMRAIRRAGLGERVRLLFPHVTSATGRESEVMVHAKVTVVDDTLLRVGSSNVCNRSMGTDTECDLVVEARDAAGREAVARVRDRMIGEHLGRTAEEVGEAVARTGSILRALDALKDGRRQLRPVEDPRMVTRSLFPGIEHAADPHRPIEAGEFLADITGDAPPRRPWPLLVKCALVLLPVALLVVLWKMTPLAGLMTPEAMKNALTSGGHWGPAAALGLFLVLGFVAFPINVLILGTAAAFGTWPGLAYATVGAMLSAAATYWAGRKLGTKPLRHLLGPRVNRVTQSVKRNGILAMTTVRLVPVAPFTLVNLVAGALRIRFVDYMAGTALGLLPGVALMSVLGDRLAQIIANPTLGNVVVMVAVLAAWAGVTWGLQRLVSRMRHEA